MTVPAPGAPAGRPRRAPGLDLAALAPGEPGRVTGVALDSRRVVPGDLYVALSGSATHGARFAAQAAVSGAVAVLTDAEGAALAADAGVPVIVDAAPRLAMADVAARVYGRPADRLELFGVTGTNGKTSTVFLLQAALAALGRSVATIGTIGFRVADRTLDVPRSTITTPESPDLQALLATMVEEGADTVAMEVSSHALALDRVAALTFAVAGFTMLGQDHLEFHRTMEDYFAAKARLFLGGRCAAAAVTIDDHWGRRLAGLIRAEGRARLVTVGRSPDADVRVAAADHAPDGGWRVRLEYPGGRTTFALSMLGAHNVANAATALGMVAAAGLDVDAAASGVAAAQVPGRMQRVALGEGAPHVVVDFAHTPQAVEAAVTGLPGGGRRLVVLGAGGERDPSKRGPMGAAAARLADVVVVTDDNPRSEDPAAIRAAVLDGAKAAAGPGTLVLDGGDRRAAIGDALRRARPGDWVAVLGKGHETGQDLGGGRIVPFDDAQVVREVWERER